MKPCVTCSARPGSLGICRPCAERAESMLFPLLPWTPFEQATIHPDVGAEGFSECYKNSRYTVLWRNVESEHGELVHLSVKRNDKSPLHDWRDLQRIKNEILGPEHEAMELYPAESRLIDTANQYHLWCFLGMKAPFGYQAERLVMEDVGEGGGKQRPFEKKPDDLVTDAEYEKRLQEHKKRRFLTARYSDQIKEILETANTRTCQRPELFGPGAPWCETVFPQEVGSWCGPCMARVLRKLQLEVDSIV
jgi:hypothetical protein